MTTNVKNELHDTLRKAIQLRENDKKDESLKILKGLVAKKIGATNPVFYNELGATYLSLSRREDALWAFKYALKLNPKDAFASNRLGNIYRDLGRTNEALKWFDYSINIDSDNFASYHGANMLLYTAKQTDKAIEYGKKVLERKDLFYTQKFRKQFGNVYSLVKTDKKNYEDFSLKNKKKRIISFSLFGTNPAYWSGAIENAILVDHVFSGWTGRFYCDNSIPKYVLEELLQRGAEVIIMPEQGGLGGTLWRFFAANDPTIDYFIVRDVDARLNSQDRIAVDEWLMSGMSFHIMRDHPIHAELMMGGLWGGIAGRLPNLVKVLNKFYRGKNKKFMDQIFLAEFVWPLIKTESLVHDEFFQYGRTAKKFSQTGKLIFPHHLGGGYKNEKFFHNYAKTLAALNTSKDQDDLSELVKYPNFRSLIPFQT